MSYNAEAIEFIIDEYCDGKDYVLYKDVIEELTKRLNCDVRKILLKDNSKYLYDKIGVIDGKQVGRITNRNQSIKIFHKIIKEYERNNNCKLTPKEKCDIIEEIECHLIMKYR